MAKTKTETAIAVKVNGSSLGSPEALRKESDKVAQPLLVEALSVTVTDEASYGVADALRSKLQPVRKAFWDRVTSILSPINEARQSALDLRHELTGPLDDAIDHLTGKMKGYRMEEQKRILLAEAEKKRLEHEASMAEARARLAKTEVQRSIQTTNAAVARASIPQTVVEPLKASHSTTRTIARWRITDIKALLAAVVAGDVPEDVIMVNEVAMNRYLKFSRKDMEQFPGTEVFDDIDIVSNRR